VRASLHVLVVAYGDNADLDGCLRALDGAYPVTVVDNSSNPATERVVADGGGHYLDAGSNLGFAAAVNLGLSTFALPATDVLLLNPDATISSESVELLRRSLDEDPSSACVAPSQHRPGSDRAASAVRWPFPTPWRAWTEAVGLGRFQHHWDYVIASVLLVRGSALAQIGGLDEGFFLYAEEADWERRATKQGWTVSYCDEATATHVGAATDPDPSRRQMRFHAGVERYVRKWHGPLGWRSYQLATVLTALRRAAVSCDGARRAALQLARLYASGPQRLAITTGAVPRRQHRAPPLGGAADQET
jgi:GT2 family glycosyltransferase